MPNVVTFLKQQFAVSLGLPWQELLPQSEIEAVLKRYQPKATRERLF